MRPRPLHALLLFTSLVVTTGAVAKTGSLVVSVNGQAAADYQRVKLANGTFKPERYVISNGGLFPGTTRDASFDQVSYPEVAGIVARYLASQQYYLALKAKDADLLIAIYWGQTVPFNDTPYNQAVDNLARVLADAEVRPSLSRQMLGVPAPQSFSLLDSTGLTEFAMARIEMENRQRDLLNSRNARILGYIDAVNNRREMLPWADVGGVEHDLIADVEEARYYVVVRAYDFKALQRDGKQVIRWETRISIGTQGTSFDERLAQMVAAAAGSFGREQGLRRRYYGDPRVELGEIQYLGEADVSKGEKAPEEK